MLNAFRKTYLEVASMVSYWPRLTREEGDTAGVVFMAKAVVRRYLDQ